MALNRFVYPPQGTNLVGEVCLSTSVNVSAAGAVGTTVAGRGITITKTGAGEYTVALDNNSTVSSIVNVQAAYVAAFDKTKSMLFSVKSTSTSGCVLNSYDLATGTIADVNIAGVLCVTLRCATSAVTA